MLSNRDSHSLFYQSSISQIRRASAWHLRVKPKPMWIPKKFRWYSLTHSGAFMPASLRVTTRQQRLLMRRYANARVLNFKFDVLGISADPQNYSTLRCEFHRIVQQIDQHLFQTSCICAPLLRHVAAYLTRIGEPQKVAAQRKHVTDLLHHRAHITRCHVHSPQR